MSDVFTRDVGGFCSASSDQMWVDFWVCSRRQQAENVLNATHNNYEPSLSLFTNGERITSLFKQMTGGVYLTHRPWLDHPMISLRFSVKSATKTTRGTRTLKIKHAVYFLAAWFDVGLKKAYQSLQIFNHEEHFSDHIFDRKKWPLCNN